MEGKPALGFFFFGTLMDRDVLERVLGRHVPDDQLAPARLPGYHRVKVMAPAEYPALVPCPGEAVDGVLLRPASRRDEARILHFEDEEYAARVLPVWLGGGRSTQARVFMALETMGRTDERWELAGWTRRHKEAYLGQCDEWMSDYPDG